jgi:hypothetical protein
VGGNLHVGLAAIGAAIGVGLIGTAASIAVDAIQGGHEGSGSILSIAFVEAIADSMRFSGEIADKRMARASMIAFILGWWAGDGQIAQIAHTFGVD